MTKQKRAEVFPPIFLLESMKDMLFINYLGVNFIKIIEVL